MEEVRYRPYGAGYRDLAMANARTLTENGTMYMERSHLHHSWAPCPMKTSHQRDIHLRVGGKKPKERSSAKGLKLWWNDPEIKRRGRVARYKLYGAEGKVKKSLKKGFRWFQKKRLEIVRTI